MKFTVFSLLAALILSLSGAPLISNAAPPCILPNVAIDNLDPIPRTAEILLVNERFHTHFWEYVLSDETVLACVGTEIREGVANFAFSGLTPGECDVTFYYKRRNARAEEPLITEGFRFYVDESLGVTYEHIHFSTNER